MPETPQEIAQRNANIANALKGVGETSTSASTQQGAESPAATMNQMPATPPTQAAVEAAIEKLNQKP